MEGKVRRAFSVAYQITALTGNDKISFTSSMLRQDGLVDSMTIAIYSFSRRIAHCLIGIALCYLPLLAMASIANPQTLASSASTAAATPDTQQVASEIRAGVRDDSRIASAVAALLLRQATFDDASVSVSDFRKRLTELDDLSGAIDASWKGPQT